MKVSRRKALVVDLGAGEKVRHIDGTIPCDNNYRDCKYVNARGPLPWEDGEVNIVMSTAAFRHFWDTEDELVAVLNECYRVLSPSGMLIVKDYIEKYDWDTDKYVTIDAAWMRDVWERCLKRSNFAGMQEGTFDDVSETYVIMQRKNDELL